MPSTSYARNRRSAVWLRDQLEALRWSLGVKPRATADVQLALQDISDGRPWAVRQ